MSDLNGNYSLSVQQGATIVFSISAFVNQEKKAVAGVMNIQLKDDTKRWEEVAVVGYGVQKELRYRAISQVKAEDLENRTISNARRHCKGKTAG